MKKLFLLLVAIAALAFSACTRDTNIDNSQEVSALDSFTTRSDAVEGYIPIATVSQKGKIELLFLQKDVQSAFIKENHDRQLVFAEVRDDGKELGLLYRIYNKTTKVMETSISYVIILKDGVYYTPSTSLIREGGVNGSRYSYGYSIVTCTGSDCTNEQGCTPNGTACTTGCKTCTKHVLNQLTDDFIALTRAIEYGRSIFAK